MPMLLLLLMSPSPPTSQQPSLANSTCALQAVTLSSLCLYNTISFFPRCLCVYLFALNSIAFAFGCVIHMYWRCTIFWETVFIIFPVCLLWFGVLQHEAQRKDSDEELETKKGAQFSNIVNYIHVSFDFLDKKLRSFGTWHIQSRTHFVEW